MSRIMLISEAGILDLHNSSLHTKAEFNNCYSASTRTEASGRRLSHHKGFFENKRFPSFFASGPIKFKVQLCKPVKILKPFELTWPLREQPSNLCMLLLRLRKKNWRVFCFQKRLRLDNLLQSSPVWVVALYILQLQWFPVHRCNVPLGELFHRPGNIPGRKVRQKPESHHRWRRICSEVVLGSN